MNRKTKIIICVVVALLVCTFIGISIWYTISRKSFDNCKTYAPGDTYKVGERTYQIPNLPLNNGTNQVNIVKEEFMIKQRELFIKVTQLFRDVDIDVWPSGGTLLGFVRHKTFICWDDDIDLHTHVKHKEYLFSPEFSQKAWDLAKLEVIFLMGFNANTATKEGAAVRLRLPNTDLPICDVFFVTPNEQGQLCKIDSWRNSTNYSLSTKEVWEPEWLDPLEDVMIDDMPCLMPRNPKAILEKQYGPTCLTTMSSRSQWISHQTPFELFRFVWTTHPINKNKT